jgi:hypothetical protein
MEKEIMEMKKECERFGLILEREIHVRKCKDIGSNGIANIVKQDTFNTETVPKSVHGPQLTRASPGVRLNPNARYRISYRRAETLKLQCWPNGGTTYHHGIACT